MKKSKRRVDLKEANERYLKGTRSVVGSTPGPHYSTAWLKAMRKIRRDPVRFYLDRIWYHNRRIRALHEDIEAHQKKIHTLIKMVKRIERKRNRS